MVQRMNFYENKGLTYNYRKPGALSIYPETVAEEIRQLWQSALVVRPWLCHVGLFDTRAGTAVPLSHPLSFCPLPLSLSLIRLNAYHTTSTSLSCGLLIFTSYILSCMCP